MNTLTTAQVWRELKKRHFAILGMVTASNEARTVGINYLAEGERLYISTSRDMWKTRHVARNPHVSVTVPIPKRVPFVPWVEIPSATITFSGIATVRERGEVPRDVVQALFRTHADDAELLATLVVIEIMPRGSFLTYGVGMSMLQMRDVEKARRRVAVEAPESQ